MEKSIFCLATYLILQLAFSHCTAKSLRDAPSERCDPLESVMASFLSNTHYNFLLAMTDHYFQLNEHTFTYLQSKLGYDVRTPEGTHALACGMAEADSMSELAAVFGFSEQEMRGYYDNFVTPLVVFGGVEKATELQQVHELLSDWIVLTGYPNAPLQNTDRTALLKFWRHLKNLAISSGFYDDLKYGVFPITQEPEQAADMLAGAQSMDDIATALGINVADLEYFSTQMTPQVLTEEKQNIKFTIDLLTALGKYGLLNLE